MPVSKDLEAYQRWASAPTPATAYALVAASKPYINHAILAAGGDPSNPVIAAKANRMFMQCVNRFDPERSTLKNFIYAQLRGLNRVVGLEQNIIQVPEAVVLSRLQIDEASRELKDELGRVPSYAEVANRTGIPLSRIKKYSQVSVPVSEGAAITASENQALPAAKIVGRDKAQEAWDEYVYDSITDRQKAVMERLYGMHGFQPMTPAQVSKELGISQAAVSQHKKSINAILEDDARYSLFED